ALRAAGFGPPMRSQQAIGYAELHDAADGRVARARAIELIKRNSRHYARRQLSWYRADRTIGWHADPGAVDLADRNCPAAGPHRPDDPRVRAADHRPRAEDLGAARAVHGDGRLLGGDPAARAEGAQAAKRGVRRPLRAAEGPARPPSRAAVPARLRRSPDGRLRRAARRPQLRRRP